MISFMMSHLLAETKRLDKPLYSQMAIGSNMDWKGGLCPFQLLLLEWPSLLLYSLVKDYPKNILQSFAL